MTTATKPTWVYKLPSDFPAPDYLRTADSRYWPFSHVPVRYKWSMKHKIAYALHCRMSQNEAESLGWGRRFEKTYWRVCSCITSRLSCDWQDRRFAIDGWDRMEAGRERNRIKLGYVRK